MKNRIEVEKVIVVNKDNFQSSLKKFKELLDSKLLDYIIFNNDISTSNKKIQDKEGEIVISEFTICKKVNYPSKDIEYTFTTFLIPSIKFHRYANDEIASFSSIFLKYLTNEKYLYDFNLINAGNSLSYENIHKRKEFENSMNLILKNGKPFKKENKTSYYYYPKAFELPSKKYQKNYENLLKYFTEQNFDDNSQKIIIDEKDKEKSPFYYKSDKYITDFKFLNSFLDFKWGQIFEKIDSDTYKVFVDEYKINFKNDDIKLNKTFLIFVEKVKNFFENEKNIEDFELEISQEDENELNNELFKSWEQYLMSEENVAEFSFVFVDKNKIKFKLKDDKTKEKKDKFQSVNKFMSFLISIPNEINNKKEFRIQQIFFRRINMRNLFPEKMRQNLEFSYHVISKIDPTKFKLEKNKDFYLQKLNYKNIFVNNKNEEEILFGYKIEPQLKQLLEIKENQNSENEVGKTRTKTISLEFGKDLDILKNDEEFKKILDEYFDNFKVLENNEKISKFRTVSFTVVKVPNSKDFSSKFIKSLVNRAKELKKKLLLDEEIGVSYFYEELFKKGNINIYGTNLKHKIYFAIKQCLLDPTKNNEDEIKSILKNVNIYDISYICLKKNIDFFRQYLNIKKDEELKERTMTQRLGYVIEENKVLRNRENLDEFKNKFYFDEKDKIAQKHHLCIDKNKFYDKVDNIFEILKKETDFTVNKNGNDDVFELSIIDPGKYGEIENISKAVENC